MDLRTRIAGFGSDVLDAWPRRRLPASAVPMAFAVAARHQPLVDGLVVVPSERTGGG